MSRRTWFDLHSWCGLNLSVLMSFVLLTGTFATVSYELDWLANPAFREYRLSEADALDWGSLYVNARAASPEARLSSLSAPIDPWFPVVGVAIDDSGERTRIFLDPETAEVQGYGRWNNWQRFFRQAHRHLMLPVKAGVTIVGLLSVPLFIAFYSGTVIYRRWWRGFFVNPLASRAADRSPKTVRRFWGDVHRWLGVWSLWFILLMAITGTWYLLEQWGLDASYAPVEHDAPEPQDGWTLDPGQLERMTAQAALLNPTLEIESIHFPAGPDRLVRIQGQASAVLVRERANQLSFDAVTGDHVHSRDATRLSLHHRISEAADPLHFGYFGGAVTRYLWFLFGLAMSALSITGAYLYGLRVARSLQTETTAPRVVWQSVPAHMNVLKWPSAALLALCLGLAGASFLRF